PGPAGVPLRARAAPVRGRRGEGVRLGWSAALTDPRRWRVLAVVPVALLLPNLEEALTIGAALPRLPARLSPLLGRAVSLPTERQFHVDLVLITVFGFALLLAARWWNGAGWALVALQAVM